MISKKMTIVFAFVFMMSTVVSIQPGLASTTALDNIKPGDTVYYKVSNYNFPLEQLVPAGQSEIDLSKVQLDLTDSVIGAKVMNTYDGSGLYLLDVFLVLGKDIVIPFPDNTSSQVTDIFGDSMTIPGGVGISLGLALPGSNLVTFLASGTDSGLPLYIEPSKTADYKSGLDSLTSSDLGGGSLTTTDGTDTLDSTYTLSNGSQSLTVTLSWFKTGDNAGFFKSFSLTGTILNSNSQTVNVGFAFAFDHKDYKPLPTEIQNQKVQTLQIDDVSLDLTWNGDFFDQLMMDQLGFNQTQFDQAQTQLSSFKGQEILRYNILEVEGLYYKVSTNSKDLGATSWGPTSTPTWFDGFTGVSTNFDSSCDPQCDYLSATSGALFPIGAPGITPDWQIWQSNMNTIQALTSIVTKTLTSSSVKTDILQYGLTLDQLENVAQLREKDGFKYFYDELNTKLSYSSADAIANYTPSDFDGSEKASLTASADIWSSYSDSGLIAGYGTSMSATLSVTNMPINSTFRGDGSLTVSFNLKIKNKDLSSLPDGKDASPYGSGGGLLPGIPGFEMVPVLLVLISIPLVSRKRRSNK